jgi:type IV secretory pathway VirB10-like protein
VTLLAASSQSVASQVTPGLLGFLVVAGMGVAVFFLFRSMNKQLKKISPDPRVRASVARRPRPAQSSSVPAPTTASPTTASPTTGSPTTGGGNSKP